MVGRNQCFLIVTFPYPIWKNNWNVADILKHKIFRLNKKKCQDHLQTSSFNWRWRARLASKHSDGAVSVHMAVGFNMKRLCHGWFTFLSRQHETRTRVRGVYLSHLTRSQPVLVWSRSSWKNVDKSTRVKGYKLLTWLLKPLLITLSFSSRIFLLIIFYGGEIF